MPMLIANVITGLVIIGLSGAPALAGGFSKNHNRTVGGYGQANTQVFSQGPSYQYQSSTFAGAGFDIRYGGKVVEGFANAGGNADFKAYGKFKYQTKSNAKTKVLAKGGHIAAKARSDRYTTIYVNGKARVVTKEVARALGLHTPLGTSIRTDNRASIEVTGSGYIGARDGSKSHSSMSVAR